MTKNGVKIMKILRNTLTNSVSIYGGSRAEK